MCTSALRGFKSGGVILAESTRGGLRDSKGFFNLRHARLQARLRCFPALDALAQGRHLHGLHLDQSLGSAILGLEFRGGIIHDAGAAFPHALVLIPRSLRLIPGPRPRLSLQRPNLRLQSLYGVALRREKTRRFVILSPKFRDTRVHGVVRLHGDARVQPRRDGCLVLRRSPLSEKTKRNVKLTARWINFINGLLQIAFHRSKLTIKKQKTDQTSFVQREGLLSIFEFLLPRHGDRLHCLWQLFLEAS